MKRKRFVKLLMSRGMQRNDAQKRADYVVAQKVSYKKAYPMASLSATMNSLSKPIQKAIVSVTKLAVAMTGFVKASVEGAKFEEAIKLLNRRNDNE